MTKIGRIAIIILNRTLWLMAGTATLLFFSESALRIAGLALRGKDAAIPPGGHVILCEGDSFTFGIGGTAYPRQLQDMLNEKCPQKFHIVNHGIPGSNTAQIYRRLAADIPRILPGTIILIAPYPTWNLAGYDLSGVSWWTLFDKWLLNLKTYKLAKLLLRGFRRAGFLDDDKLPKDLSEDTCHRRMLSDTAGRARALFGSGEIDRALDAVLETLELSYLLDNHETIRTCRSEQFPALREILIAGLARHPGSEKILFCLGEYHFRKAEIPESAGYFEQAIKRYPGSARSYAGLAMCRMRQYDAAGAYGLLARALAIQPTDFKVRMAAARYYINRMDYARAAEELDKISADKKRMFDSHIRELYFHSRHWEKLREFADNSPEDNQGLRLIDYKILSEYWRRKGDEARSLEILKKGLLRYPNSWMAHGLLGSPNFDTEEMMNIILEHGKDIPAVRYGDFYQTVLRLRQKSRKPGQDIYRVMSENFEKDLWKICGLARTYGARLILASYPQQTFEEVEKVAREYGVRYINLEDLFAGRFDSKKEYLSADYCHCNSKGYGFMAEIFAREILESQFHGTCPLERAG
ncbi:MAG: hypothetical protein ABIG11_10740 [bacterium]